MDSEESCHAAMQAWTSVFTAAMDQASVSDKLTIQQEVKAQENDFATQKSKLGVLFLNSKPINNCQRLLW